MAVHGDYKLQCFTVFEKRIELQLEPTGDDHLGPTIILDLGRDVCTPDSFQVGMVYRLGLEVVYDSR